MPPTDAPSPRSLSLWLIHLEPLQPPVDPAVREALLTELAAGNASSSQFAALLQRDPPQVLAVLREANRALRKYGRDTATVEHAITLLGTERVRQLLLAAPVLDPDHPHALAYRQSLLRSRHAAWQARLWAEGSARWHPEDIYWSTLLAGAPVWLLELEAGPLLQQLARQRAIGLDSGTAAQRQLLGTALAPICAALAERWQLPAISRHSWQPAHCGSPRQWLQLARAARLEQPPLLDDSIISDLSQQPALIAALANALAREADWDWYSRRTLRLLRIAASCCRRPITTLVSHGHRTAAALSRFVVERQPDLLTPAARLLCHWREAEHLAPAASPAPPATVPQRLTATLQQLRQTEQLRGPRDALALATGALTDGIGLRRAAVLHHSLGSGTLQGLFSAGFDDMATLRLPATGNPLLERLLARPLCLVLGPDNRERLLPLLPEPLRSADSLLLMGVFAGRAPLALIHADNAGKAIDATQVEQFKQLCQQLSATLGVLVRRRAGHGN